MCVYTRAYCYIWIELGVYLINNLSVKIINDDPGPLEICWILISNFTLYLISQLKALSPPWASNFKQSFFLLLFFLLVSLISIFVMDVDRNAAKFKFGHSCVCAHFSMM